MVVCTKEYVRVRGKRPAGEGVWYFSWTGERVPVRETLAVPVSRYVVDMLFGQRTQNGANKWGTTPMLRSRLNHDVV